MDFPGHSEPIPWTLDESMKLPLTKVRLRIYINRHYIDDNLVFEFK